MTTHTKVLRKVRPRVRAGHGRKAELLERGLVEDAVAAEDGGLVVDGAVGVEDGCGQHLVVLGLWGGVRTRA